MVSNMSLTSWRSDSSNASIGCAFWRSTGSPYMRTGRAGISALLSLLGLVAEDLHHGALGEFDLHFVGNPQHRLHVVDAHHRADDASGRDDAVAFLQLL